jgi:hypothetical protein
MNGAACLGEDHPAPHIYVKEIISSFLITGFLHLPIFEKYQQSA